MSENRVTPEQLDAWEADAGTGHEGCLCLDCVAAQRFVDTAAEVRRAWAVEQSYEGLQLQFARLSESMLEQKARAEKAERECAALRALREDEPIVRCTNCEKAERERDEALRWDDAPLPEDEAIKAAHPTRTERHETYGEAMRLVGACRSKGKLVALVNWLLSKRLDDAGHECARCRRMLPASHFRDRIVCNACNGAGSARAELAEARLAAAMIALEHYAAAAGPDSKARLALTRLEAMGKEAGK